MNKLKIILSILLLFSLTLACNLPVSQLMGLDPTALPPAVATDIQPYVVATTETSEIILTITETQLNTLITEKLSTEPDSIVQQPAVIIGDEKIILTGKTIQSGVTLDLLVEMSLSIDIDGKPVIKIESAKIGPLEAPQFVKDSLTSMADEMLTGAIGTSLTGAQVERITIEPGYMVITIR